MEKKRWLARLLWLIIVVVFFAYVGVRWELIIEQEMLFLVALQGVALNVMFLGIEMHLGKPITKE